METQVLNKIQNLTSDVQKYRNEILNFQNFDVNKLLAYYSNMSLEDLVINVSNAIIIGCDTQMYNDFVDLFKILDLFIFRNEKVKTFADAFLLMEKVKLALDYTGGKFDTVTLYFVTEDFVYKNQLLMLVQYVEKSSRYVSMEDIERLSTFKDLYDGPPTADVETLLSGIRDFIDRELEFITSFNRY